MSQQALPMTKARFRRRRRRTFAWTAVIFATLICGALGSALWLKERELVAPAWLRDQIAAQLTKALPEVDTRFGAVVAVIDAQWRPRFFMRDLELRTPEGLELVTFSEVNVNLDTSALMQRRISLTSVQASGVFVTLRRMQDGTLDLSAGLQSDAASRQAPNLIQLVNQMDAFLLRPALADLQSIDIRAITLRYLDRRADRAWTVDGGRMRLDRAGEAVDVSVDLALLGGSADVATLQASYSGVIGQQVTEFGLRIENLPARDIASQGAAFSWLGVLEAPISGGLRGRTQADGTLAPLSATLQIGSGVIQPTPEARPIPIEGARSYFSYLPDQQLLRFDELSVQTQWGSGRLEGQAQFSGLGEGRIDDLVGQFQLTGLRVNPDNLYPDPVNISAAELDFRLRLAPFSLEIGRFQVSDEGQMLTAQGAVSAGAGGWNIALDGQLDGLAAPRLLTLWPERVKKETRSWIAKNLQQGQISEATAALRIRQGGTPDVYLAFEFNGAEFTFTEKMPPVKEASGHASLFRDRFVVILDAARLDAPLGGSVDTSGTSFIIPDTKAKPDPPAVVRLAAQGSVTAALSLLDLPPLEVMKKAGQPVTLAQGQVGLTGTLSLPLKKKTTLDEIAFDMRGNLRDVFTDQLVAGRSLKAPELVFEASETGVRIAGRGTLEGIPLDVEWVQPLGAPGDSLPGRVTGEAEITQDALDTFGIALPGDMVAGRTRAALLLDLVKGAPPQLSLRSDLQGLSLRLPPVGWSKPAATPGALELVMTLGDDPQVDRLSLEAPGLSALGSLSLTPDRQLDRLRLDSLRIGGWLDAPVDIVGRGPGRPVGIVVRSGQLDLRRADFGSGGGGAESGPLTVALDRLQISDTIALTGMEGDFTTTGGLQGAFTGAVNGAAPVSGRITPQGGRSAIEVTARNAGRVMAAAGLTTQAKGGRMDLRLEPVGTGGAFDGLLSVQDVRITEAPAMAALLNSISVVGLINELSGDGIYFSEVTADFRLAPSRITLREASAVGASMGLSMDGYFEPDTGKLQMQGVISPVYVLNAIGSVFTRRGEGLFGFNYSITGTTKAPQVFVNPLTALAPGMFRNLFRAAPPEVPLEEGETAPVPEPRRQPVVTRGQDR